MKRLSLLVDLANLLTREVDLDTLLETACARLAEALDADRASIWLVDAERGDLVTRVAVLPEVDALRVSLGQGIAGHAAETGQVGRVDDAGSDSRFDPAADRATGYVTRTVLAAPVRDSAGPLRGVVQVLNRRSGTFDKEDESYLSALASQLAVALSLTTLRGEAQKSGVVLRGPFNRIVGRSPAMEKVYQRILKSAGTDATVLLSGQTGTGKTLLARAIHVNSARQSGPFVTVDATTLPAALVESQLFGHERGAFTGANRRAVGRVEAANGGTLFLDEVGDLPLESQGKLLRFLQSHEFERVGGTQTLTSDVRILSATHRDLERLVRKGTFREDLFYRLRVVSIEVPALAERGEPELLRLLEHFIDMYEGRHHRTAPPLSGEVMKRLLLHRWPGNVRELEHWVESTVVLGEPAALRAPGDSRPLGEPTPLGLPLSEVERRYVERTVKQCGGNRTEAARSLQIGRNTVSRVLNRRPSEEDDSDGL